MTLVHFDSRGVPPFVHTILALFSGTWPHRKLADSTAQIWADNLSGLNADAAVAAARMLVRENVHWPAISEFLVAYHIELRRQKMVHEAEERARALPEPGGMTDRNAAGIANCRQIIAELGGDKRRVKNLPKPPAAAPARNPAWRRSVDDTFRRLPGRPKENR